MKHLKTTRIFLTLLLAGVLFSAMKPSESTPAPVAEGIDFFHGTFAEAQAKAKKEGKLIFVDAYTVWCSPCRWMAANTFTNADVGAFFNKHFINLKIDMEKGEGRTLSRKWAIRAYPTLLFMSDSGEVNKRVLGAQKPAQLLALGKDVVGGGKGAGSAVEGGN